VADERDLPSRNSLGPADLRWLRSEFTATREQQAAGMAAIGTRLDEHNDRLLAVESSRHDHSGERKRRLTLTGLVTALLTVLASLAQIAASRG
jgi:hypothetical protein